MNGKELKAGDVFRFEGSTWKCKKNDGFMLSADNVNPKENMCAISWIGSIDKHEVELVKGE